MSYSHNIEADFAASELASMFASTSQLCYAEEQTPPVVSASASFEPSSSPWPKADGVVTLLESGGGNIQRNIALEYKRPQEGIHGILTAIGQAHAYLHKGYNGVAIVIPKNYSTLDESHEYVRRVLETNQSKASIGVFGYDEPDLSSSTPFRGRLTCARPLSVNLTVTGAIISANAGVRTQWVHMREGSTTRDGFFRFLQSSKLVCADSAPTLPILRPELVNAIAQLSPGTDPYMYLSNTSDDKLLSRIWREFWFRWIATPEVLTPWVKAGSQYVVPGAFTRVLRDDETGYSQIFEGRSSSLKQVLVNQLNAGTLSEADAWKIFVAGTARAGVHRSGKAKATQGVRDRAHSYREDIDSALGELSFIDHTGRLTDVGHRFTTVCERFGGPNSSAAKDFMGAALLQLGHYGSFLHYVYRLSEEMFSKNPLMFAESTSTGPKFTEKSYFDYLAFIETKLSQELKVMRKAQKRSYTRRRTEFQAELTLLRRYGFISETKHRLGVGIPIDWIKVQEAMSLEL